MGLSLRKIARRYIDWNWRWNLDSAFRYEQAVRLIKVKKPRVIVEVGCGSSRGISSFSGCPSFGVDIGFDMRTSPGIQRRIIGSGAMLPFRTGVADFVLSTDVLEHVPPAFRGEVVREMFRIAASDAVIYITVPAGKDAEEADYRVHVDYLKRHKRPHVMLRDHVENKLPKQEDMEGLVRDEAEKAGWKVSSASSTPIWIWELNLRVFAVERWVPGLRHFQRAILQWAYPIIKTARSGKNYRITLIASRDKGIADG